MPPRMQKRARPLGRRHGCSAPGTGIRRAGAGVPEPRASFAPLREPQSEQDHHEPQAADEQYGLIKSVEQENTRRYPDDPYAHQRGYEEEPEPRTRRGGMVTVAAALALAVVGTGLP